MIPQTQLERSFTGHRCSATAALMLATALQPGQHRPGDSQRSLNMNIDLSGKRAIVAGGSRGIGRAIALAFAGAGASVSICARGAAALEAARAQIPAPGGTAH